eukprot:scaffold14591_cov140-Isochrysis_galbana.AAC.9
MPSVPCQSVRSGASATLPDPSHPSTPGVSVHPGWHDTNGMAGPSAAWRSDSFSANSTCPRLAYTYANSGLYLGMPPLAVGSELAISQLGNLPLYMPPDDTKMTRGSPPAEARRRRSGTHKADKRWQPKMSCDASVTSKPSGVMVRLDVVWSANVTDERLHLPVAGFRYDLVARSLGALFVPAHHVQGRPTTGQVAGEAPANPCVGSRHYAHPAFEAHRIQVAQVVVGRGTPPAVSRAVASPVKVELDRGRKGSERHGRSRDHRRSFGEPSRACAAAAADVSTHPSALRPRRKHNSMSYPKVVGLVSATAPWTDVSFY